jgi:hypothetical protein
MRRSCLSVFLSVCKVKPRGVKRRQVWELLGYWIIVEFCTKVAQNLHKICTKSAQNLHKICTKSAQTLHKICANMNNLYANMNKLCTRYAKNMHKICTNSAQTPPNFAQTLLKLFTNSAQTLHKLCTKYIQTLHKLCTKYTQNMYKICTKYAQNIHKICTKNAQKCTKNAQKYAQKYAENMHKICTNSAEDRKRENESGTVLTSKTNILKKIAERKLPGNVYKNEEFLSTSMITTVRGGQSTVQKSTKGVTILKKFLEMQKIWGENSVRKYPDGPRLSARGSTCAEPIANCGPTNYANDERLESETRFISTPEMSSKFNREFFIS